MYCCSTDHVLPVVQQLLSDGTVIDICLCSLTFGCPFFFLFSRDIKVQRISEALFRAEVQNCSLQTYMQDWLSCYRIWWKQARRSLRLYITCTDGMCVWCTATKLQISCHSNHVAAWREVEPAVVIVPWR